MPTWLNFLDVLSTYLIWTTLIVYFALICRDIVEFFGRHPTLTYYTMKGLGAVVFFLFCFSVAFQAYQYKIGVITNGVQ